MRELLGACWCCGRGSLVAVCGRWGALGTGGGVEDISVKDTSKDKASC